MAECRYRPTERAGLYFMVFIILLYILDLSWTTEKMEKDLAAVKAAVVKAEAPEVKK